MRFIQNLSIRNKLLLISLIPIAVLLYFVADITRNQLKDRTDIRRVEKDVQEIQVISDVIHDLQQERGYSTSYLVSRGVEEKSELFSQRSQADQSVFNLRALRKERGEGAGYSFLPDSLAAIRTRVNGLTETPAGITQAFGVLTYALVDTVNLMYQRVEDPRIKDLLEAHLFLLYAEDYFGQMRSLMRGAFLSGGFSRDQLVSFAMARAKYEINITRFRENASDELAGLYDQALARPDAQAIKAFVDSAVRGKSLEKENLGANTWRADALSFLNALKDIGDHSTLSIRQTADARLSAITSSVNRSILTTLLILGVMALLLFYTVRSIVGPLGRIKNAADRIRKGEVDLSLHIPGRDEIGSLAASFNELIAVTKAYAKMAETIGKGDYSPAVDIRGEGDMLGIALNTMKENLQALSRENETRTWLLTGSGELNDKMRGEKDVHELAQEVIGHLAAYLRAQVGALYLSENGHLDLAASYAFYHRKGNTNTIRIGEGLVGQAALEKQPIVFSRVPEDYMKINSGLGDASPVNIIVYPFLFDGKVKGVIEVGAAHSFSELDRQFLDLVSTNIGIAFNSSQSRAQLKELLEETQRQAEELEAQQEELRQINEELQEKTNLLEKSEEELKVQQEELQQTNEELEEKANLLGEQKEKLELAKMDIETKARELELTSKYKSEFLANMSHELRTPLNSILILAQLLSENKSRVLGEKEVEYARNIYSSGTDLLELINEILDLSKVESGKIELDIAEVNVEALGNKLRALFSELANHKAIDFTIRYPAEELPAPFYTDEQRVEQILRNLLSNAFKFTGRGGKVSLAVERVSGRAAAAGGEPDRPGDLLIFSVTDSGIGIPEEKQEAIFQAFQQADGSTKRKYGGTGLGLSISRELAHALGGNIGLESREGKGSTFTLQLPLKFDPAAVHDDKQIALKKDIPWKPGASEENGRPTGSPSAITDDRYDIRENDRIVLVVEDDEAFSAVLLQFLRERGYKGIVAHQGNTGLSLARYYRPDAIVLDMQLPVMDGAEVLKQLKSDPDLRHTPVQIISGYDKKKESLELGAFDFIRKPVTASDMQSAFDRIEEFLHRKLKKLLVVEDNKQQNKAIRELIGNGDVKSSSAYAGLEAYEMMKKEKFDCIIIDLGLPDMSGFDLLEKIRASDALNKIPIIVYTGKDLDKEESARLNKLANTVVLKTASSKERLLDETILFLHRVESNLPREKQQIIRKLHRTDEVLRNKKVLLVDDDMRNIYSLTNVLEEEGLQCITAENGRVALRLLNDQPGIDIVLMDVMMPEMDGYEATREIRRMEQFNKLPVIALTAKAMKGDREKCLEAGMSDYIMKPVNIEQLLSLMRVWLYR